MALRLPADLDAKLTELAARERISKQQLTIRALDALVADSARRDRFRTSLDTVLTENSELLDRLAET